MAKRRRPVQRQLIYNGDGICGFSLDGQEYRFLRLGFYQDVNAEVHEVAYFASHCFDCGEPMEVWVPRDSDRQLFASRRCDDCKQPGKRANQLEQAA